MLRKFAPSDSDNYLENGRYLQLIQDNSLWTVDLCDKCFRVDVIMFVRVDCVQLRRQVLERKVTDVKGRVSEIGVARSSDAKTTLPVVDETRWRWLNNVRAQSRPQHRQERMRPYRLS